MALSAGDRLGHFEILAPLGAGGMGEVYRARDMRLDREVAIKVLPETVAQHPDRLARFDREARLLASLSHQSIATLHGLEEHEGKSLLVMEVAPGETLAERIRRGPIPVDDALAIARHIAEGLEAAHEQGIVHRDLKPANVMVTDEGRVKILDFGLAKALHPGSSDADLSHSPTLTAQMTAAGVLLGTAAYMSPEQARGKTVDKRADIWAFGCCLYEALTGARAFGGDTVSDAISTVLAADPDWDALPADLPQPVRRMLQRCLDKDSGTRLRDIGEARVAIDDASTPVDDEGSAPQPRSSWKNTVVVGAAAAALAGAVVALAVWAATRPAQPRATRLAINPPAEAPFSGAALTISPDGTRVIFAGANNTRLIVRAIDELEPKSYSDLGLPDRAFVSPDGQWIGFFDDVNSLYKMSINGGPRVFICSLGGAVSRGGSWSEDGSIFFATDDPATGLWRVRDGGGEAEVLTRPEQGQNDHLWPHVLPGGQAVLLTVLPLGLETDPQVAVLDLESGDLKTLLPGSHALYVPTGHLVYGSSGSLRAVAFDLENLEIEGASVLIRDGVASTRIGEMAFSVSGDGTLVYVPGGIQGASRRIVWVDRQGNEELLTTPPGGYYILRISPDGAKVALDNRQPLANIWIWHFDRRTMTRFTFETAAYPVWTPDGKRLVFTSFGTGVGFLSWRASDGSTPLETLSAGPTSRYATTIAPDGTQLVFREEGRPTGLDLFALPLDGSDRPRPLVETQHNELNAEISPDGRWLAYKSNETRRDEIYVRPYPNVDGGRWQISSEGGVQPAWAPDGRELFFRAPDGALMQVPVELQPGFSSGTPRQLIAPRYLLGGPGRAYDISPDGERFLMITMGDQSRETGSPPSIVVVQNWFEELKRILPR